MKFQQQIESLDPLTLQIEDDILSENIRQRLAASEAFYEKQCNLTERQEKMERYLKGQQVDESKLHDKSHPYMENIFWEAMVRNRSIIMSRMPDLVVKGENNDLADKIGNMMDTDIKRQENKETLAMAVTQRPFYFYGVIKAVWRPDKNDYEFVAVNPKRVVFDHTNVGGKNDDYDFVAEWRMESVRNLIEMFPGKREEIFTEAGIDPQDSLTEKSMASKVKLWEVWFKDDESYLDEISGKQKKRPIVGVAWRLGETVLKKMKHPYWDWQGKKEGYEPKIEADDSTQMSEDDVFALFDMKDGQNEATTYYNYFKKPEIPYFIVTLNRWGEHPIDISSNYEQTIYFQDHINIEGRQISDINTRSIGKDVYNSEAITKKTVESLDPRDFDQNIVVDGAINNSYRHVGHNPAPPQMYNSKSESRQIAFEMMALNATTRGVSESAEETLGSKQMMREQDFGVLDYEADGTLNKAARWMARWGMQFIKRYYKLSQFKRSMGKAGEIVYEKINRDMIGDGMEVVVSASGVDKMKKKRDAMAMANLGIIDPLTFYKDIEASDPIKRTKQLMMFKMAPQMYLQNLVSGGEAQMPQQPQQPPQPTPPAQPAQPQQPPQQTGQPPQL